MSGNAMFNEQSETQGFFARIAERRIHAESAPEAPFNMRCFPQCGARALCRKPRLLTILKGLLGLAALSANLQAGTVNLAWNGSPGPSVTGYDIYYGQASGAYTSIVNAGANLTGTVTGLTPGLTYYFAVAAYDAKGDQSRFSSEITSRLPAAPSITVQPLTQTAIAGLPVTLTVSAAGDAPLSFQWMNGLAPIPGATAASLNWPQVASSNAGNYSLSVSNPSGSVTSSVATLTVIRAGPLSILAQPQSQTAVVTKAASFSSVTIGAAPLFFQWYDGTTAIPGATNSALAWSQVADSNAGNYYFTVSNFMGAVTSSIATLTVIDPPSILVQPQSRTVMATTAATFLSVTAGTAPLSFQWYNGTIAMAGATNSVLAWSHVADSNVGNYHFTVSNVGGVVTSSVATLTVIDPPSILTQPQSRTAIATTAASLLSVTAGTAPLSFQWYDGKIAVAGGTNSVLAWAHVADSNVGNYHFTVSNVGGVVTSSVATLTVIDPPSILTQPQSQTVISATPAAFSTAVAGTAPLSFQWYNGTTAIAGATNSVLAWPAVTAANAGNYQFRVSNAAGVVTSSVATLTVLPTNTIATAAGVYNGLFFQTNTDGTPNITEASAGFLGNCVVTTNGAFSAKIYVGGLSYTFEGGFNGSGNANATISRPSQGLSNLTVIMNIDLINGTQQMGGSVSSTTAGNAWTSTLTADLATNAYSQLASINVLISPGSGNAPTNYGVASGVVTNSVLSLAGVLGDNTAISQTVPISNNGYIPLYFNLYNGDGLLEGWVNLSGGGMSGNLTWIYPGTGTFSTGAFNTVVQFRGTTFSQ
jgi:hypothetical protein